MMQLSVALRSELGGRKANEDSVNFCSNETRGCFVLADGTGGHKGGALASETVVKQVLAHYSATPKIDGHLVSALMTVAREALFEVRKQNPQLSEMNTTIATLVLDTEQEFAYWNYLGDSRIYLFRNGRARSLTTDHSILQSMIDAGYFTGELRGNYKRNMLYAAVGSEEMPEQAIRDEPLPLQPGDIFLLCSDGFWENISEDIMEDMLREATTPEQWIDNMMNKIPDPCAPDLDNYSALAVWVGEPDAVTARFPAEENKEAPAPKVPSRRKVARGKGLLRFFKRSGYMGWFGKLPSTGDFASRGIPHFLKETIHGWMSSGMAALAHSRPQEWQAAYLVSPVWHFLMNSGIWDRPALVGCLAPSVDKVGRFSPLMVLRSFDKSDVYSVLPPDSRWLYRVDAMLRRAIGKRISVDDLHSLLRRLMEAEENDQQDTTAGILCELGIGDAGTEADDIDAGAKKDWFEWEKLPGLFEGSSGCSFWWTEPSAKFPKKPITYCKTPDDNLFCSLMDGGVPNE